MKQRIPKGCDQQGRYPEAFETSELHDEELDAEDLGHSVVEVLCLVIATVMLLAILFGWLPGG